LKVIVESKKTARGMGEGEKKREARENTKTVNKDKITDGGRGKGSVF